MSKVLIALFGFSFFLSPLYAQNFWYEEHIPKFRQEILDTTGKKKIRISNIYRDLSFIGQMASVDSMFYSSSDQSENLSRAVEKCEVRNAIEYIIEQARDQQIVIINESHCQPKERHFTKKLLKYLKNLGFTYLGLEAITSNSKPELTSIPVNRYNLTDTLINERGYPLMKAISGSYVKEPQFGNMIREAVDLDYVIFGYENFGKQRELDQATNIARILSQDPHAKILIHCGGGHLNESHEDGSKKRMAEYLKELTGIDPLTINQIIYSYDLTILEEVFSSRTINEPVVLAGKNGNLFQSIYDNNSAFDIAVIHPKAEYINGRPSWLVNDSELSEAQIQLNMIGIPGPLRIKIIGVDERMDAVPVDVYEPLEGQMNVQLYYPSGDYKLIIENKNKDRLVSELITTDKK